MRYLSRSFVVCTLILFAWATTGKTSGIDPNASPRYLEPKELTGTIYADASRKKVLFTFKRTATIDGSDIRALREYYTPDGKLAASEKVVYRGGKLHSYKLEELQNGTSGSAEVQVASKQESRIHYEHHDGRTRKSGSEKFQAELLINDMVVPFIHEHWTQLMRGETVKCRMISVSRTESVGFKFVRESEAELAGRPVVIVRLEPSSVIVGQFINPLRFTIEKDGERRVLRYVGRTTPSVFTSGKWRDVDAVTVFDWK